MLMIKTLIPTFLLILILDFNSLAQDIVPEQYHTSDGLRNLNESVYLKGSKDTIFSFINNKPIYRIILQNGRLFKTTLLHPLSSHTNFDSKGRIESIEYWDSSGGVLNGLFIKFSFWKSGKVWACNSSLRNIPYGTNFMFTHKGRMSLVLDSQNGIRVGKFWEETKKNGYRVSSYSNNVLHGNQRVYNRRNKIISILEYKQGELIDSVPNKDIENN
jgi:antitoxin component YwqK of YwqJK toxin-antitoxin module